MTDESDKTIEELLALEGPNAPEHVSGPTGPQAPVTAKEQSARRNLLARLITSHASPDQIYQFMERRFGMSRDATDRLEIEVYKIWQSVDTRRTKFQKSISKRRIQYFTDKAALDKSWTAVMAGLKLEAEIDGVKAPIEVRTTADVKHTVVVEQLWNEMDPEERAARLEAERARLLESGDAIDVTPALIKKDHS